MLYISCKQCYVPSIGIGQVSALFYLKSVRIGSIGENWYWYITTRITTREVILLASVLPSMTAIKSENPIVNGHVTISF